MSDTEQRRTNQFLFNVSTAIAGVLVSSMLVWIASSQLKLTTTTALIQHQLNEQQKTLAAYVRTGEGRLDSIEQRLLQVWPRLRAHGENIEILRRETERLCSCKIEQSEPEDF